MFDEDKMLEKCLSDEIKITGQNDERRMNWVMISTHLHIPQSILENDYDK